MGVFRRGFPKQDELLSALQELIRHDAREVSGERERLGARADTVIALKEKHMTSRARGFLNATLLVFIVGGIAARAFFHLPWFITGLHVASVAVYLALSVMRRAPYSNRDDGLRGER